jgi:hypothetical protein
MSFSLGRLGGLPDAVAAARLRRERTGWPTSLGETAMQVLDWDDKNQD